jgi:hypothetical protein
MLFPGIPLTHFQERNIMSKLNLALAAAVLTLTLGSRGFAVTNAVVGTCKAGTQFATVQAAVTAATAGSTIQVCPGTYAEQVEIKAPLTLKGVPLGASDSVVIRPPAKGITQTAPSGLWGTLYPNVYVHTTATAVNFSNITIDGGGGTTCPASGYRVGLLYQATTGTVSNAAFIDSPLCTRSIAVMADATTSFNFTANVLSDCGGICLEMDFSRTAVVNGNTITQFKNAYQGIEVQQFDGPATISANTITGNLLSSAILTTGSPDVTISGNNIVIPQAGNGVILLSATHNVVQSNHISGGFPITINDNGIGTANTVTGNVLKAALCGVDIQNSVGDVLTPNTIYTTQSSTCAAF